MNTEVMVIEPDKLDRQISPFVQMAQDLVVNDNTTFITGSEKLGRCIDLRKFISGEFKETKEAANKAHKNIVAMEKKYLDRVGEAEEIIRGKLKVWKSAQDELLRIEQAKQEEEHLKLVALAAKEAAKAVKKGNLADAMAIKESVPEFVRPESTTPKTGYSIVIKWKARVIDADKLPKAWMIPDMDRLNNYAKTYKEKGCIPGVEFYPEESDRMGRL